MTSCGVIAMTNRKSPRPIFLINEAARLLAIKQIRELPADGTYKVSVDGRVTSGTLRKLAEGIELDGERTAGHPP